MLKLKVKASKKYNVIIDSDINALVNYKSVLTGGKVALIIDENVNALYPNALKDFLGERDVKTYVVNSGENSKSYQVYISILEKMLSDGFKRSDTVVAFGGGVVGDLAGFISATYMRGINLIQIPTTILSAVDSSVGGKTAINLSSAKNVVGAFYQPSLVYICLDFFKTLPSREIYSGKGEILKYAFLSKSVTPRLLQGDITERLIYECVKIKRNIVNKDEKEKSVRALLNLGHTVGHAIESLSSFSISHGKCVAMGLSKSIELSKKLYNLPQKEVDKMNELLSLYGEDLTVNYSLNQLIEKIKLDKKGKGETVNFITLKAVAKPRIENLNLSKIQELLQNESNN